MESSYHFAIVVATVAPFTRPIKDSLTSRRCRSPRSQSESGCRRCRSYLWSGSSGLILVIALSMAISMGIAGMVGASIPIVLSKLGQDPAQSSSIVLTTVTDVAGFFGFLGIETIFIAIL